jgi:hypothetical protein
VLLGVHGWSRVQIKFRHLQVRPISPWLTVVVVAAAVIIALGAKPCCA